MLSAQTDPTKAGGEQRRERGHFKVSEGNREDGNATKCVKWSEYQISHNKIDFG